MAYYTALISQWALLTPGTTAAKLAQINALTVAGPAAPLIVPTYRIYNVMDAAELAALTAAAQQRVRDILSMGTVDASLGTNVRAALASIFAGAGGATTRGNLLTLANSIENTTIPWWQATVAQGGGGLSSIVTNSDLIAAGNLT